MASRELTSKSHGRTMPGFRHPGQAAAFGGRHGMGAGLAAAVHWPAGLHPAGELPWGAALERFFDEDLTGIRIVTGAQADAFLRRAGLIAAARGEQICLSSALMTASRPVQRRVLAHEVAHVLQQTRGARWAGRVTDQPADLEREACEVGAAFGAGLPQPARVASAGPAGVRVQGHDSFEHRLLGDTPTAVLNQMVANNGTSPQARQQALQQTCDVLAYLGGDPFGINQAELNQKAGFPIRLVTLLGSGLTVTYGELNTMADFLTSPAEIDVTSQQTLLPILQMIRQSGYNRISALLTPPGPPSTFTSALADYGSDTVNAIADNLLLDGLTLHVDSIGRDHYFGVLARNACHFAPYTWWRWQASYAIACTAALAAYQGRNQPNSAELVRLAWLRHGYADHFLQDSFAAGHLINKTLIMQWFIEWAQAKKFLPVYGWDAIKNLTVTNQPDLSGPWLYQGASGGALLSNDPQTSEELLTQAQRIANTGVVAAGGTQAQAYQDYLTMLDSRVCQTVVLQLHDLLNGRSVSASSPMTAPQNFTIWGDDTMLAGGTGVGLASTAAQLSQSSIGQIIDTGSTTITWESIFSYFPDQVTSNGTLMSLQDWHAENGELWQLCHSRNVFDSWTTWLFGGSAYQGDMGIVSVDQLRGPDFEPAWGAAEPVGWASSEVLAACPWNGSTYLFYLPDGQTTLACIRASSSVGMSLPPLPHVEIPVGGCAAAVLGGTLTVVYGAANNTLSALMTADGQAWTRVANFAGLTGVDPAGGVAIAQVGSTQYVMFAQQNDSSSLWYVANSGQGWGKPIAVRNSEYGSSPALATDGQALFVAFQHGNQGIYTGQLKAGSWTGPSIRSGIETITGTGVSLTYAGGLYLSYQGTDYAPHWESWNPVSGQWSDYFIKGQRATSSVCITQLFGQPSLIFGQGTSASPSAGLAFTAVSAGTADPLSPLGAFASDTPPLLLPYAKKVYAFSTGEDGIVLHTFDGARWSAPELVTVLSVGSGRLGGDVQIDADGNGILWLAAAQPDGSVQAATFDGTAWKLQPAVAPEGTCQAAVSVAVYGGVVCAFWESDYGLYWSQFNEVSLTWTPAAQVPLIDHPVSTTVTVSGDTLYVGYACANPLKNNGLIYTIACNGTAWQQPFCLGSQQSVSVTLASFDDKLVIVLLGKGNQILYSLWSDDGGQNWQGGSTSLGGASTAPGLTAVASSAGDDTHTPALLAVAGWPAASYAGQFSRQMTTPGI